MENNKNNSFWKKYKFYKENYKKKLNCNDLWSLKLFQ